MIIEKATSSRELKLLTLKTDLCIIGGGLAGVCTAITAAREGVKVVVLQDRPVLGGNASSEVRLWALGATSHQGNNNRWSREGGVMDEIMVENTFRNKEGNPLFFDALLLEKVNAEANITLLLNTAMLSADKRDEKNIKSVRGFCSQNSTMYEVEAPLFCDSSGDGILAYLSGAAYRVGAEAASELNEPFAPDESYGELLGHTIYFYSKTTDKPVKYVAPDFALKDITKIPRHEHITVKSHGCSLWWLEYGGRMDTVHDTEAIKWELWKVAYGVWDHLKNSGKFPETANQTLEWIGSIPGKRESRRVEGDYMLSQSDIVDQKAFDDAVSFGGWAIDLHPADGVYSDKSGCSQFHSAGVYQIPYRCFYSRNIENLFVGGRLISASHVAFGSTRVMMTCGHNGQAIGMAAAMCHEATLKPRDLLEQSKMRALQTRLIKCGHYIPHVNADDHGDLVQSATLEASSELKLKALSPCAESASLEGSRALLLPAPKGAFPQMSFKFTSAEDKELVFQLRGTSKQGNFTPDITHEEKRVALKQGKDVEVTVTFDYEAEQEEYLFVCIMACPGVSMQLSDDLISGMMSLSNSGNKAVSTNLIQEPPEGSGFDSFEFWLPERRPGGKLPAVTFSPPLSTFAKDQIKSSYYRPFITSNLWLADSDDKKPSITAKWDKAQAINKVVLFFDVDHDHAMESVQFGHHDDAMPFCVKAFQLKDGEGNVLYENDNNHHGRVEICFPETATTDSLVLEISDTHGAPAAVFSMQAYG